MRSSLWLGLHPDFNTENSGFYTANSMVVVTDHVGSSLTKNKKVQMLRNSSWDKTNKMNVRFFQMFPTGLLTKKARPLNVFRDRSLAEVAVKSSCKTECAFNCNQLKSCFYFSQLQKKRKKDCHELCISGTLWIIVTKVIHVHEKKKQNKTRKTYQAIKYFP